MLLPIRNSRRWPAGLWWEMPASWKGRSGLPASSCNLRNFATSELSPASRSSHSAGWTPAAESRRWKAPTGREAERRAVLVEKIFLLETEPGAGVIRNRGAGVARMRGLLVGHEHLAHDERAVLLGGVGIDGHGLEHAIGGLALGLARRAAVEVPPGKLFEFWEF